MKKHIQTRRDQLCNKLHYLHCRSLELKKKKNLESYDHWKLRQACRHSTGSQFIKGRIQLSFINMEEIQEGFLTLLYQPLFIKVNMKHYMHCGREVLSTTEHLLSTFTLPLKQYSSSLQARCTEMGESTCQSSFIKCSSNPNIIAVWKRHFLFPVHWTSWNLTLSPLCLICPCWVGCTTQFAPLTFRADVHKM